MDPVLLNPANPDDVVISVFSLDGATPTRYPTTDPNGWSLCAHFNANSEDTSAGYGGFTAYFQSVDPKVFGDLPIATWSAGCTPRTSQFTSASLTSTLGSVTLATPDLRLPKTGAVVVEIFYNYPQLLKLPVLTNVLPDPIPLYVYSIMPLSAAQPTQGP
jgi:hypothetical protein